MNNIKAIALDMDGTILYNSGEFPKELVKTLVQIQEKGIKVFLATGRTYHEIIHILPKDFQPDGKVAASGMGVYINKERVFAAQFKPEFVETVLNEARQNKIAYEIHTLENSRRALLEDKEYIKQELMQDKPNTMHQFEYDFAREFIDHDDLWLDAHSYEHVVKLYFYSYDIGRIRKWYNHLNKLNANNEYSLYTTSDHNAEIMLGGIDKATGLEKLNAHYSLSFDEMHVVGDSMNDIPMFKVAAYKTAMQNGSDELKEMADDVTKLSNNDNGLNAYLIEKYL